MERKEKTEKRDMRRRRVRAKIFGVSDCPRISVFRSNKYISLQLIDDEKGESLLQANDIGLKNGTKTERARKIGKKIAEEAKKKNIKKAVFDRGGYAYHGRVKASADGCREGGLKF
ncbi:50S ribosomal protein L18 [Patescibacteria group bacterium]|nr:50S ribosomal protein L18 [Patescibacteria group bacterium]MBU2633412.1 50S ribosomal protein L18 [Patescibacteria group bacterium]